MKTSVELPTKQGATYYAAAFFFILAALTPVLYILVLRPSYGVMDDANHVYNLLPQIHSLGLWQANLAYLKEDLLRGVFRITYPPMVALIYGPGGVDGPITTFALNWLAVVAITAYASKLLSKLLDLPALPIFGVNFAFFYFYDFFQHPSLQEKLLVLFGAGLIYLCSPRCNLSNKIRLVLLFLCTLLGASTKTSFVIFYLPASVMLFYYWWVEKKFSAAMAIFPFLLFCFSTLALGWLAHLGTYSGGRYSIAHLTENLTSRAFFYLSFPVIFGLFYGFRKSKSIETYIPALTSMGFFLVFLPWGIAAYIQTIIIPFLAAAVVQGVWAFSDKSRIRSMALLGISLLAVGSANFRSYRAFTRLADLRAAMVFLKNDIHSLPAYATCGEGAGAMSFYLATLGKSLNVSYFDREKVNEKKFLLIGDLAFCPRPDAGKCQTETLFRGKFEGSFQIQEWNCL